MKKYVLIFITIFVNLSTLTNKKNSSGIIEKSFIEQFLPNNPIILEAGAHIGVDTVEMATRWPNSTIYAFEPVPNLFNRLKKITCSYKNIICFDYALDKKNGLSNMFISSGSSDGSSSLLEPKEVLNAHPTVYFDKDVIVKTITLDEWAKKYDVTHIDFMWLDLQGSELDVLKASPHILKTVLAIYTEVSLIETYHGAPLYTELRKWLEEQGFFVIREELPWKDMGNVLFARKN